MTDFLDMRGQLETAQRAREILNKELDSARAARPGTRLGAIAGALGGQSMQRLFPELTLPAEVRVQRAKDALVNKVRKKVQDSGTDPDSIEGSVATAKLLRNVDGALAGDYLKNQIQTISDASKAKSDESKAVVDKGTEKARQEGIQAEADLAEAKARDQERINDLDLRNEELKLAKQNANTQEDRNAVSREGFANALEIAKIRASAILNSAMIGAKGRSGGTLSKVAAPKEATVDSQMVEIENQWAGMDKLQRISGDDKKELRRAAQFAAEYEETLVTHMKMPREAASAMATAMAVQHLDLAGSWIHDVEFNRPQTGSGAVSATPDGAINLEDALK